MANFYSFYPPSGGANPSVGTNGVTAPTSSTEVGGINPSGNLQPLQTDSAGNLLVSLSADPIDPLGVNIEKYGGVATTLGQKAMAASIPVAIASDQSAVPISAASLPLPTGAATSANQTTEITALTAIEANQTNGTQVTSITGTLPLPTGAATAANQTNGSQETQIVQGGNTAVVSAAGALKVDGSAVTQPVSAASLPLPAGASTSALQTTGNTTLSNIQANQTNGTQVTTVSGTLPLPTGAATAALQSNVQSSLGTSATTAITVQGSPSGVNIPVAINSSITIPVSGVVIADIKDSAGLSLNSNGAGALTVAGITAAGSGASSGLVTVQGNASGTPIPISGTVTTSGTTAVTQSTSPWVDNITQFGGTNISTGTGASGAGIPRVTVSNDSNILATQSGTWNITNISGTVSLPTGAATSANQTNASQKTQIVDGSGNVIASTSNALNVNVNNSIAQTIKGTVIANSPIQNVYSTTNITTSAYVQLVASTTNTINTIHIFDSSGQAMILGIGGAGSEVTTLYVPPGGDTYTLNIPSGSRLAYKALTATANSGYLLMSFLE